MQAVHDARLRETIHSAVLPSGLRVMVMPRAGWREATARVAINYGSNDSVFMPPGAGAEVSVPDGIAHFLEHKLFEKEWGNAFDKFADLGAESNAYTSHIQTVYYFSATEHFSDCLDVLLDMVQTPWFTPESVAKEQGIIAQEIRMYLDNPEWRSRQNLMEALYHRHPVRIDVAGTEESISAITADELYRCHKTFYHPSNMMVFVAGDVDPETVLGQIAADFARRGYAAQGEIGRIFPQEPVGVREALVEEHMRVSQPIFRMAFKDRPLGQMGRPLLQREMLMSIILDAALGRASKLYNALYEDGLIDGRFGFDHNEELNYAYTVFAGPSRSPEDLEQRLKDGFQQLRTTGLDAVDFERAKRKTLGRFLSFMNHLDSIAYVSTDGAFKDIHLFDVIPATAALTVDQANARLREHFTPDAASVSLVRPK